VNPSFHPTFASSRRHTTVYQRGGKFHSGTSHCFLPSKVSRAATLPSLHCQLRRFRNKYLDEAETLPVYIWYVATRPSRELMGGLLSLHIRIMKILEHNRSLGTLAFEIWALTPWARGTWPHCVLWQHVSFDTTLGSMWLARNPLSLVHRHMWRDSFTDHSRAAMNSIKTHNNLLSNYKSNLPYLFVTSQILHFRHVERQHSAFIIVHIGLLIT